MLSLNPFHSLYDLTKAFPDEASCISKLEQLIWKGVPISPFDSASKIYKCKGHRYKCVATNKYFSVLNNTIFEGTKISLQKWFMAIYLEASHKKGISSHQLARDIEVTQKTAWFILQRIRYALEHQSFAKQLNDIVEADETYIGGKYKNMHKSKKSVGTQGRSTKDKVPVFGLVQRNGALIAKVVVDTKAQTIQPLIHDYVEKGSKLMTDEWWAYSGLGRYYEHRIVMHRAKQYVDGEVYTNTLEGFWGLLKRGILGIYHSVSRKYLQMYVDEFVFRYNTRKISLSERFDAFLEMTSGRRLLYKQLIS